MADYDFERRWDFSNNRLATMDDVADHVGSGGGASLPIAISDVTGLQAAIDDKAASVHTHLISGVTGLQSALDNKAALTHSHVISDVTGLQAALDGKSATGHLHAIADVTGLATELSDLVDALASKAESVHTHTSADISGAMTLEQMAPGGMFVVNYVSGDWRYNNNVIVARPSARSNIRMLAVGGPAAPGFALTHDMWAAETT